MKKFGSWCVAISCTSESMESIGVNVIRAANLVYGGDGDTNLVAFWTSYEGCVVSTVVLDICCRNYWFKNSLKDGNLQLLVAESGESVGRCGVKGDGVAYAREESG